MDLKTDELVRAVKLNDQIPLTDLFYDYSVSTRDVLLHRQLRRAVRSQSPEHMPVLLRFPG